MLPRGETLSTASASVDASRSGFERSSASTFGNPPGIPMERAPAFRAISTSSGLSPT
mgnify:CR=1 FL=1